MIGGICVHPDFEFVRALADFARLLREIERGFRGGDRGRGGLVLRRLRRDQREGFPGLFEIARSDVTAHEARERTRIRRIVGQDFGKQRGRLVELAGREFRFGFVEQFGRRIGLAGEAFDEGGDLAFGQRADEASTGWPLSKANTAGIDWMPSWPAICGCLSMSIFTSFTAPPAARTAFSSTGVSDLQGPHHSAQKSTSTGRFFDSSITSFMKVCVVVSEITSPAFAGAAPFPVFNSIFLLRWAIEFEFRTLNGVEPSKANPDAAGTPKTRVQPRLIEGVACGWAFA